ncbi:MAG TPA: ribbon-helix-helix domain-containing protein [Gemmataceae bacterium]|nr:ribbon-helix-helix domain-containing protein [Gemmataceae bacterium]
MNTSQPRHLSEAPTSDSLDTIDIIVDGWNDPPSPPRQLSPQERLELRRVLDSYSIEREKLDQVNKAAQRLGRSRSELIREGLELVLEKYHDKLGDLANPESSGDAPKPEGNPPSA